MSAKHDGTVIYEIRRGTKPDSLEAAKVGTSEAPLAGFASVTPLAVGGRTYLLGYDPAGDAMSAYEFTAIPPSIKPSPAKPKVGAGLDLIEPFVLGDRPYLALYTAKKGIFHLVSVADDLSASAPYEFYRNHEPGLTQGFTTARPFTNMGQVTFLGYNGANGYVALYTLAVTATSAKPGVVPPLLMTAVWSHMWAKGWTRFAFFQFGGSNFFFKTNTVKWNVNIDHVLDDLSGTVEVGTLLDPKKTLEKVEFVEPFAIGAQPYFVAYEKDGAATLNRFHGDCLGWTKVASFKAPAGAAHVTPVSVGGAQYLIIG